MSLSLEQAIARVPLWAGATDLRTAPLGGGITNQNFKVDAQGESFVLRIGGEKTELLGIDRRNEYAANQAAAGIGLAPPAVYFVEPEGYLVTRFLTARPLPREEMGRPENIRRVAQALKRFHSLPAIPGVFSPFRVIAHYAETARQYGVAFPSAFDEWMARVREIETALERFPFTPSPCHNDLLNENFLFDGEIRILDWEYAGIGDPAFDLANFAVHHGFDDDQDRLLLEYYLTPTPQPPPPLPNRPSTTFAPSTGTQGAADSAQDGSGVGMGVRPVRFARHKLLKIVSDCREGMWGLIQIGISKLDFDFRGYADKHFYRMAEMMRHSRYEQWLAEFSDRST